MNKTRSTSILFAINLLFWLGIFVYYTFIKYVDDHTYWMIKFLLLLEPIMYAVGLWGYWKASRFIYVLMIPFLIINLTLSLTDQMGFFDWLSAVFNLMLLIALITQWKDFFAKSTKVE